MKRKLLALYLLGALIVMVGCGPTPGSSPTPTSPPPPAPTQASSTEELQIFTEEYPPVTFSKDGKATGLGTEIVDEIMRRLGTTITIRVEPWARGYKTVSERPKTALFAMMRTEEREKLFKWVGPLTQVNTSFYAQKDSQISLTNLEEAKLIPSIGVPREYYSHQYLRSAGFTNLDEAADPEEMVKKFLSGRTELMVNDNITLAELLKKNNATLADVKLVYTFLASKNYIAFSQGTPDELVQQWQKAIDDMRADGTITKLYEKWLPGEMVPEKDK